MTAYDLNGKVALITGAARGIGLETARAMHARGGRVVLADLEQAAVDEAAANLGGGDRVLAVTADVTDRAALDAAVQAALDRFGALDVLVANAGIAHDPTTIRNLDEATWDRVIDVNLQGVWRSVRASLPHVIAARGHLVLVASIYAFANGMGQVPYAVAKAGVEQLGRALRSELAHHGVGVTVAYFGFIDTEMVHQSLDANPLKDRFEQVIPKPLLKRLPPSAAGEGIASATERRAAMLILPRRWTLLSALRGIIGPAGDRLATRDPRVSALIREIDAA
jgi:NAD(P)-dependent dehydrogenase (short-subunit alcohol dehydrogenase family)